MPTHIEVGLGYVVVKIKRNPSPLHKHFDFCADKFWWKSNVDETYIFRLINPCFRSCCPQSVCLIPCYRWRQWDTFVRMKTSIKGKSINDSIIGSRFYNSLIHVYSFLQHISLIYTRNFFGIIDIVIVILFEFL